MDSVKKYLFFMKVAAAWIQFGHHLQAQMARCQSYSQLAQKLNEFFEQPQKILTKTELRY